MNSRNADSYSPAVNTRIEYSRIFSLTKNVLPYTPESVNIFHGPQCPDTPAAAGSCKSNSTGIFHCRYPQLLSHLVKDFRRHLAPPGSMLVPAGLSIFLARKITVDEAVIRYVDTSSINLDAIWLWIMKSGES